MKHVVNAVRNVLHLFPEVDDYRFEPYKWQANGDIYVGLVVFYNDEGLEITSIQVRADDSVQQIEDKVVEELQSVY